MKQVIWNYVSVVVMSVSGLIMTGSVAYFYDSTALGMFNESYAWYMILSQLSTWGIHMAVLKYVPEKTDEQEKWTILFSAVITSLLLSSILLVISEFSLSIMGFFSWKKSMRIALLGLPFFSLNKILINYINARFELIAVAVFQTIRYGILATSMVWICIMQVQMDMLTAAFPFAELLVLICITLYVLIGKRHAALKVSIADIRNIFSFGTRILPANMVVEMNTKVDVVCLGFLLADDAQIGVYSFAILFTEGFYTLFYVIRRLINPGISESNAKGMIDDYIDSVKSAIQKYLMMGSFLVFALIIIVFYTISLLFGTDEYAIGLLYITIIGTGIILSSKSILWGDFLSQMGYPGMESKVNVITVVSNIVFNCVLILRFGTVGASIGTALSYLVYAYTQKRCIFEKTGKRIG